MDRHELERQFAQRMAPLSRAWRQLADAAVSEFRLSHSTGWCLIYVNRLGPDARQTDLALEIGVTQPSLVRTIDQLESAGLVRRVANPGDRRSNRLELTDEGKDLVGQIEERLANIRHKMLDGVSDKDLAIALGIFDIVSERAAANRA